MTHMLNYVFVIPLKHKCHSINERTNETRYIERYKTCKCKCKLDASVCNNKQKWSEDKC